MPAIRSNNQQVQQILHSLIVNKIAIVILKLLHILKFDNIY